MLGITEARRKTGRQIVKALKKKKKRQEAELISAVTQTQAGEDREGSIVERMMRGRGGGERASGACQ